MQHTRRRTLSALAGRIIGYRKDGRPIRLAAGGSGEGGSGGDGGGSGSGDGTSGTDGGEGQGAEGGQGDGTGKTPVIDGEFDKDRHARALAAAREGEKKAKAETKAERDRVAAILKAAGLTPDGKTDPAEQLKELTARAEAAETKARQSDIRDSVRAASGPAKADAEALLDSSSFMARLADLDTSAKDFADKVAEAVKEHVKANPRYAAAPAGPGKQGADHSGSGGSRTQSKDLNSAVARKLGG